MSLVYHRTVSIKCDYPGCRSQTAAWETARRARNHAEKTENWVSYYSHGDFCSDHRVDEIMAYLNEAS